MKETLLKTNFHSRQSQEIHSKVLTYQKFQTWKCATACTGLRTGAKNLETGIPLSRTSDISKLAITRTESSFLPSVQNCTLNFSNSAIFRADLRFPWSVQKSVFQSRTIAVFWCTRSYSCVVEWTNYPSRARVPFFFTIIRLGISDYKTKISFPHCRKMHSWET